MKQETLVVILEARDFSHERFTYTQLSDIITMIKEFKHKILSIHLHILTKP